jgi:hypothetical protein
MNVLKPIMHLQVSMLTMWADSIERLAGNYEKGVEETATAMKEQSDKERAAYRTSRRLSECRAINEPLTARARMVAGMSIWIARLLKCYPPPAFSDRVLQTAFFWSGNDPTFGLAPWWSSGATRLRQGSNDRQRGNDNHSHDISDDLLGGFGASPMMGSRIVGCQPVEPGSPNGSSNGSPTLIRRDNFRSYSGLPAARRRSASLELPSDYVFLDALFDHCNELPIIVGCPLVAGRAGAGHCSSPGGSTAQPSVIASW